MGDVITEAGRVHLRWALTDGVGPLTFSRLIEHFGDAAAALGAPASALQAVKGIGRERADSILRGPSPELIEREIDSAAEHGVRIVCRADPDCPEGLRRIPDPPTVLYIKGELRPTDAIAVAIVGSRRCSLYGGEQARRFGELLAGVGVTVVSGLARGIDAFAQHGAVDAGGRSIAVMGAGLRDVYPPENRALAEKILASGAWVSELPMLAAVRAENFPARNRIIAGMTLGTLVVEAAARSGALITARLAAEYNREVFAVPGRVQDPTSIGTNALIRDGGAKLVTCLEDVLAELGEVGPALTRGHAATSPLDAERATGSGGAGTPKPAACAPLFQACDAGTQAPPAPLSDVEQCVYGLTGSEPILQDVMLRAAGAPVGDVLAAITALELKGLLRRVPGNLLVRRGK